MAQFILYNYQFTRIESRPEADLFGGMPIQMTAEEAFPQKQQILSALMVEDYKERKIKFRAGTYVSGIPWESSASGTAMASLVRAEPPHARRSIFITR